MKCYPEYKESGVGWIGQIPEHWKVVRSKHLFGNRNQRGYEGEALLSVTQDQGVLPRNELDYRVWNPDGNIKLYKLVRPGDWVISLRTFEGGIELSEVRGIVSAAYTTMSPLRQIYNSYFKYLLKSVNFIAELNRITTGIRQGKNISYDDFSDTRIVFPPLSDQKAIGNFLDRKTGQIDELIRIKERQIELLQEQRTALINQAVTKGLDPNVEMKPSGVEWIGEIPKHWTITRLKYLGESIIGLSYKPEDVTDDKNGTLVLRASNIQNGKPSFLDNVYVNAEVDEKLHLKENDILICSRSGSRELIGKNITITKELEGITFGVFMTIFRTKFFRFISYFLNSQVFKNQSGLFLTSTINQLTINTLNNFLISFPTEEREQAQIANFLDRQTQQIDELIAAEGRKIELLKEYRQSLISEAVTGKIDVRNEV